LAYYLFNFTAGVGWLSNIRDGRIPRVLAAHRWVVLVFAVAAGLRVAVAIVYRPALFFWDSWEYLDMAYRFPVGVSAVHPSGYPLLIKPLSLFGHHVLVISTIQHLAGLAVGLLVYLLLTRAETPRWLAAAATGLVTWDLYAITLEQTILPETFFSLALLGAAYLAIRAPPTTPALVASGALLAAATLMRPAGAFAFPAWFLYLAFKRVGWRPLVVGLLAFAVPLVANAGAYQRATGKFGLVAADGWFLYGRVGEIAAPCGEAKIPVATRALCERRSHKANAPRFYIWADGSPARKRFGGPWLRGERENRRANRLLHQFAVAIIRDRPRQYGELVVRDFGQYFRPGVRGESRAEDLPATPEGQLSPHARRAVAQHLPGFSWPRKYTSAPFFVRLERWLHTPRWLMAFFAGCAVTAAVVAAIRRRIRSSGRSAEALFLVGSGLLILLGSAATSAFILRYLIPEVPLFVCGGILAIHELLRSVLPAARSATSSRTPGSKS
jgi:hypothetical protein